MILIYEFIYISNNGVIESFLRAICDSYGIEYYITKEGDKISLCVKDENEKLENFSKKLSESLPYSIFLKSAKVYVGDKWDMDNADKAMGCEIYLPFTKEALEVAKRDFDPFIKNEVGQNYHFSLPLILEFEGKSKRCYDNFEEIFELATDIIAKGGKVNIKTLSGVFCVSKIENRDFDGIVMLTDLSCAGKIAVLKNEEVSALASLEKPILRAHTNLIFASKYPKFPRFIKISMASDLFLYLLSLSLFKKDVEFILLERQDSAASAYLYFEQNIPKRNNLEICALQNGQNIVISGNWHIKPTTLKAIKILNNARHTQFAASMHELKLLDKANCGIYLSLKHDDMIMFYSEKTGVLDILSVEFDNSILKILSFIENQDEIGGRLIKNYKREFEGIFQKIENISFENDKKNISNLCGIAALLAGLGEDLSGARQKLLENADIFGGEKGPRIDYKLTDENSVKTSLDAYKFLRSVISFKLAGVDEEILSYGIIESLVYFLSDFADRLKGDLEAENILLMGSLFGCKTLSNLCSKHLSPNHKLYFNKEIPIEICYENMQNL